MKAGKINNYLLLIFLIIIALACNTLRQGVYLSTDKSKIVKLDQDSTFIFWADSPLLIGTTLNRYANGFYKKHNKTLILSSSKKDKTNSIQFVESKKIFRTKYNDCWNYLVHFEIERSNFTMLPGMLLKAITEKDTTIYHFSSDSLILINCGLGNSFFDIDGQILIQGLPYSKIDIVMFKIENLEYKYEITDKSANTLDIYVYNQKYDTLEYREFSTEEWDIRRNCLIDIKNNEIYKFVSDQQISKSLSRSLDTYSSVK